MQKGKKKQKYIGNHPIKKKKVGFFFYPSVGCDEHFQLSQTGTHNPNMIYGPGDPDLDGKINNIPTIKCQLSNKILYQEYIEFVEKLKPFNNDVYEYKRWIENNRGLRGNNKTKLKAEIVRWMQQLSWNYIYEDEPKAILIQKKYHCFNEAEFLPRPLAPLTDKKPKLTFEKKVAVMKQREFPKSLLLPQGTTNNFRSTIQAQFGKDAFSTTYFFSKNLPSNIQVDGMYKQNATKQKALNFLMDNHERLPLRIDKSGIPNAGKGVFSEVDIPEHTMLMLYVGQQRIVFQNWPPSDSVFDLGFIEAVQETEQVDPTAKKTQQVDPHGRQAKKLMPLVVEPITKLNAARYINTTKDGKLINLTMQKIVVGGMIGLLLSTKQNGVKAGQQLFYDYGRNYGFGSDYASHKSSKGGQFSRCVTERMSQDKKTRMALSRWQRRLKKSEQMKPYHNDNEFQHDVEKMGINDKQQQRDHEMQQQRDHSMQQKRDDGMEQQRDHNMQQKRDDAMEQQNVYAMQQQKADIADQQNYLSFESIILFEKEERIEGEFEEKLEKIESESGFPQEKCQQKLSSQQKQAPKPTQQTVELMAYDTHTDLMQATVQKAIVQKSRREKVRENNDRGQGINPQLIKQIDLLPTRTGKKLRPHTRIRRLFKRYSRKQYQDRRHKFPRMREHQIMNSYRRDWERMTVAEKIVLYKDYVSRLMLRQESDTQLDSQQSVIDLSDQDEKPRQIPTPKIILDARKKEQRKHAVRPFIEQEQEQQDSDFARQEARKEFDISQSGSQYEQEKKLKENLRKGKPPRKIEREQHYLAIPTFSEFVAYINYSARNVIPAKTFSLIQSFFQDQKDQDWEDQKDQDQNDQDQHHILDMNQKDIDQRHILFRDEEQMVQTRRNTFRTKSTCVLCKQQIDNDRRGNHLKQKHMHQRAIVGIYLGIRRFKRFWVLAESYQFKDCKKWRLLDFGAKHDWRKSKHRQAETISQQQHEAGMAKALFRIDARFKKQKLIVQNCTQGMGYGREKVVQKPKEYEKGEKAKHLSQAIRNSSHQWVEVSRFFKNLIDDRTMQIFDTDGKPAILEDMISNFYMNRGKRYYIKKNGHTIIIPNRASFKKVIAKKIQSKKAITQQMKKSKLISKITKGVRQVRAINVVQIHDITKKKYEVPYQVPRYTPWDREDCDVYICPTCGEPKQKKNRYHLIQCAQQTTSCRRCNVFYNRYSTHQCRNTNHLIQVGDVTLSVSKHIDMIIDKTNDIASLIEHAQMKMIQQQQKPNQMQVHQQGNYVEDNKMLRQAHEERITRMKTRKQQQLKQIEQDYQLRQLGPDRGKTPQELLKNGLEKCRNSKSKTPNTQKPIKGQRFRELRRKYVQKFQHALYNLRYPKYTSLLTTAQRQHFTHQLTARIEFYKWIQHNNECAICLSQLSPHVKQFMSRIWSAYLKYDKKHIAVLELYEQAGIDHQKDDHSVRMDVIRLFANKKVLRQCTKCFKMLHLFCWLSHQQSIGDKCPYCRSQGTMRPPSQIVLTGTQDSFWLEIGTHEIRTMLQRLGVYLDEYARIQLKAKV